MLPSPLSKLSSRPLPLATAVEQRNKLIGKTFVLTNGCFDLLHPGHVSYLNQARELGDCLWVLLNSTQSIKAIKGPNRPIQSDDDRAYMLENLTAVSGVTLFDTPRLTEEILALKPDVYAKAGDYTLETLDSEERTALHQVGARIHLLPFVHGFSTTNLIEKIKGTPCALLS